MKPQLVPECHLFERSRESFEALVGQLSAPDVMRASHEKLEELITMSGKALLRQLFQDHLDLRGEGRVKDPVTGSDGTVRTQTRVKSRYLETVFGRVCVRRVGYSKPGLDRVYPKDGELNLPAELYSHGVRKRVAIEAAKSSFQETVQTVSDLTGAEVGKRQAEELASRSGQDFEAFYEARGEEAADKTAETGTILILSTDAKGVVMRQQDLREATRRAAEQKEYSSADGRGKTQRTNSKRMAMVATVYTVKPFVRRPEDIVAELRNVEDLAQKQKRPRPENKRVWASLEKEPEQVIEAAFQEGLRRDPAGKKQWVIVVDGSESQLASLLRQAREHAVEVTIIIDIIHVIEYLWKASSAFHSEDVRKAEEWVRCRILQILRGRSSDVAAGMRRSATLRALLGTERKPVDTCADYLLKYADYLHYDEYLTKGFPIASGVIEGACRHLIKDRLDITGARWSLKGAEAILKLRSLRSSGDFEEYWAFHTAQEYKRNHAARYINGSVPSTSQPCLGRNPAIVRLLR